MANRRDYMKTYYESHKIQNRLRNIWNSMKQRCRVNEKYYKNKGIKVCEEWMCFDNFQKWALSNGYSDSLTIDRIDNSKGYTPENCRWSTRKEQQRNTSYNKNITYNGETHCIREWAEIIGVSEYALRNRIRRKWDVNKALTQNIRTYKENKNGCKF